jgi:excisionase family DNA binding protein
MPNARIQTISGVQTVDEGAEPLRARLGIDEAGATGFGEGRRRRYRDNQITFFTIADVAERLQVSRRTVRRWIEGGHLAVHRVGGIIRIAESDLRAFLSIHREI